MRKNYVQNKLNAVHKEILYERAYKNEIPNKILIKKEKKTKIKNVNFK